MSVSFDWLAAAEACERSAEEVESFARRRRNALLTITALLLIVAALCVYPQIAGRNGSSRPCLGTTPARPLAARSSTGKAEHGTSRSKGRSRSRRSSTRGGEGEATPVGQAPGATPSPYPSPVPVGAKEPLPVASPLPRSSARVAVNPWIWIHVAGAVARPGVVRLPTGSRGFHAVRAAGGLLPGADLGRVNLSRVLKDESMLVVPDHSTRTTSGDAVDDPTAEASPSAAQGSSPAPEVERGRTASRAKRPHVLDINRASVVDLQALPGIGPGMATAIVSWRKSHGPFRQPAEVMRVPRVGPRVFERIRPYLRVGSASGETPGG